MLPGSRPDCGGWGGKGAPGQAGGLRFCGRPGTADSAVVLTPGSRRRTHSAPFGRCVQTTAASQCLKRASAPTPEFRSSPPKRRPPTCPSAPLRKRFRWSVEGPNRFLLAAGGTRRRRFLWRRAAQAWGSARLRASSTDSPRLSERSETKLSVVSSAARPPGRAAQCSRRTRRPPQHEPPLGTARREPRQPKQALATPEPRREA